MTPIRATFECIAKVLNDYFQSVNPTHEPWVKISNLIDGQGNPNEDVQNKIVLALAGITHETTAGSCARAVQSSGDAHSVMSPNINISLLILIYANFSGRTYPGGLDVISEVIKILGRTPYFSRANTTFLTDEIDKLTLEIVNIDFSQLSHLMTITGGKYLPSILYKVRGISYRSEVAQGIVPGIRGINL